MRSRPALWVALAFLALGPAPALGQQSEPSEPSTVRELEEAFAIDEVRSDFVVVIDTSGSMEAGADPLYPKVKQAFAELVDALPSGDHLSVVTFDSVPTTGFNGPVTEANRAQARTLPERADGDATDIGAALNSAVEKLDRPGASGIQTVVFITDGEPQPPTGSVFDPVGSPAWDAARTRAASLEERRSILVRALGLTAEGKAGAELVGRVFGKPEVVQLSGEQLGDYLTSEVENARRRVLAKAIEDAITDTPIAVEVTPDGNLDDRVRATVTLTSELPIGVDVDLDAVEAKDFNGDRVRSSIIGGSRTIHLSPNGTAEFEIELKPDVERAPLFSLPPPGREEVDVTLDFAQSARATPTQLLRDELGVDVTVAVERPDGFSVGRDTGKTWGRFALEIVLALIAAFVAFKLYWRFLRRPPLVGELVLHGLDDGGPVVQLHGKKMTVQSSDFGRPGRTTVRLYTKRGKAGVVFAERIGLEGSFERYVKHRWKPVEGGSALGVVEYRLDGQGGARIRWRRGGEEA